MWIGPEPVSSDSNTLLTLISHAGLHWTASAKIWICIFFFAFLSFNSLIFNLISLVECYVLTLQSFPCTNRLGTYVLCRKPLSYCWQWKCLLGLVFRSGTKQERDLSPITCLAPLYLLPWPFPQYQQRDHLNQAASNVRASLDGVWERSRFRDLHNWLKSIWCSSPLGWKRYFLSLKVEDINYGRRKRRFSPHCV